MINFNISHEIAAYSGWRLHKDKEIDERERLNLIRVEVMGLTSILTQSVIGAPWTLFRLASLLSPLYAKDLLEIIVITLSVANGNASTSSATIAFEKYPTAARLVDNDVVTLVAFFNNQIS